MSYSLGVDLGTTFTAAATSVDGQPEMEILGNRSVCIPTTVYVAADSSVLIGEAASRRGLDDPSRFAREFKRRVGDAAPLILGGSPYSAESLMARVLAWVVALVTEHHNSGPEVVAVTHPANWRNFKKGRLADAIALAGLGNTSPGGQRLIMLSEPEAAARYYASIEQLNPGQLVAVYDLGGGTFDATIFEKTEEGFRITGASQGIEQLGGMDFDAAVLGHVDRVLAGALSSINSDDTLTRDEAGQGGVELHRGQRGPVHHFEDRVPGLAP